MTITYYQIHLPLKTILMSSCKLYVEVGRGLNIADFDGFVVSRIGVFWIVLDSVRTIAVMAAAAAAIRYRRRGVCLITKPAILPTLLKHITDGFIW